MQRPGEEELYFNGELEKDALHVQAEHTEESDKAGMVYEYLDTLLPPIWGRMDISARRLYHSGEINGNRGTVKRTRMCAMEVWCEAFGGDPKLLSYVQSREIRTILDNAEGWKRDEKLYQFKIYGRQRSYIRIEDTCSVKIKRR